MVFISEEYFFPDVPSIRFISFYVLFQALKEAFEVICNIGIAGNTSAELLATFCDDLLKKGSSEKLSDEDIEETLDKVALAFHLGLLQL